jgi:hypothetical protein
MKIDTFFFSLVLLFKRSRSYFWKLEETGQETQYLHGDGGRVKSFSLLCTISATSWSWIESERKLLLLWDESFNRF